ncbi:MAG TPA: MASE1 domain-containing protein [Labilithrix sp.]|nr:MASE1 domain-containing protein [Labilithrix sp.]
MNRMHTDAATHSHPRGIVLARWALAYFCAHVLGILFMDPIRRVAVIWPASGVTIAALLTMPRRHWPRVLALLGAVGFVTNVVANGGAYGMSFGFFVANAIEGALAASVVKRIARREVTFTRVDDVLALGGVATLINAVTALVGAAAPWLFEHAPYWPSYRTWWISNALGIVLVTPLAVVWAHRSPPRSVQPRRPVETALFVIAWCLATWFITVSTGSRGPLSLHPYMLLCLVPWAALRLGMRTVTASMTVLGAMLVRSAIEGRIHRDFAGPNLADGTAQTQLFVALATFTGLLLCASVTEGQLARRAADRSTDHLALALDSARMGAWEWDAATKRVHWSDRVAATLGLPAQAFDARHESYYAFIHHEDRENVAATVARALASGTDTSFEHRIVLPNGTVRWIEGRGRVYRDSRGKPIRMAGTVMDITRQRQVEAHLRESQKMDAIGQLAGGVAHDFNNILAAILTQAEVARARLRETEIARELLDEIVIASRRGAVLTKQLLAFARRQIVNPKAVDLNVVVSDHAAMLRRLVGEHVNLRVALSGSSLVTRVDTGMLGQVLMNLTVNARDAMERSGDVTITTAEIFFASSVTTANGEAPAGTYHSIRVTDTGSGIPPENMRRLFEPFFTTKPPDKGTGLGLATVFGIVKLHNGYIRVTSKVGEGTSFEILLRPSEDALASLPRQPTTEEATAATILLVEDDTSVRKTTHMLLEMNGYDVIDAKSGDEALRLWEEHSPKINLLFTDLRLSKGVNGRELAADLRRRRADLKVILTSGYSPDLVGREIESGDRFLMKPAAPQELLNAISRALSGE